MLNSHLLINEISLLFILTQKPNSTIHNKVIVIVKALITKEFVNDFMRIERLNSGLQKTQNINI